MEKTAGDTSVAGKLKDASEFARRAIEQSVAFVPGAPFYAADADAATLRLSFATADVGKVLEGCGVWGRHLNKFLVLLINLRKNNFRGWI